MTTDEQQRIGVWERYSQAWSPVGDHERMALLEASLHPDARYADPNIRRQGRAEIAGYMAETQTRMPGVLFRNQSVAQHNDTLLAHWLMISGDGAVIAPGVSFARFKGERLVEMNGFFPTPPIAP